MHWESKENHEVSDRVRPLAELRIHCLGDTNQYNTIFWLKISRRYSDVLADSFKLQQVSLSVKLLENQPWQAIYFSETPVSACKSTRRCSPPEQHAHLHAVRTSGLVKHEVDRKQEWKDVFQ